jgi:hypothetical protein
MMDDPFVTHRREARKPLIGTETVVAFLARRGGSVEFGWLLRPAQRRPGARLDAGGDVTAVR